MVVLQVMMMLPGMASAGMMAMAMVMFVVNSTIGRG